MENKERFEIITQGVIYCVYRYRYPLSKDEFHVYGPVFTRGLLIKNADGIWVDHMKTTDAAAIGNAIDVYLADKDH